MLSHLANSVPAENSVVEIIPPDQEPASASRRASGRWTPALLSRFDARFFHNWFVEGPKRLISGRFSKRAAGFMIASAVPGILTFLIMTIPGILFHTPEHHAFYFFAKNLEGDSASILPVVIGTISSIFGFRFPLGA